VIPFFLFQIFFRFFSRVYGAEKVVGLQPCLIQQGCLGRQTNSPHCIPVADDYMSMLRKAWKKPSQKPQFKIDCRRMAFFRVRMTVVKDPLYWSLYWGKRLRIFDKNEDLKVPFNAQHIGFY